MITEKCSRKKYSGTYKSIQDRHSRSYKNAKDYLNQKIHSHNTQNGYYGNECFGLARDLIKMFVIKINTFHATEYHWNPIHNANTRNFAISNVKSCIKILRKTLDVVQLKIKYRYETRCIFIESLCYPVICKPLKN